jgi:hydroxyacylglutathione hydrolase
MFLETIKTPGLAQISYLVGDENAGVAAVIDPRRDIEVYLERARAREVRIAHAIETHVHADFVSGGQELAARSGATLWTGVTAEVEFPHEGLRDGAELSLGDVTLAVRHTPGHSPEHVSMVVSGGQGAAAPWGVLTGDTLFAGSVGRPDLSAEVPPEEAARDLYRSLFDVLLPLGDELVVHPGHGSGSPCGVSIGDRDQTTIGYERRHSPLLDADSAGAFVEQVVGSLPPQPFYYPRLKRLNRRGAGVSGGLPHIPALAPEAFDAERRKPGSIVVDVREIEAFGGAHIGGSLNIALRSSFPIWAGWMLEPDQRLLLVVEHEEEVEEAQRQLFRIGLDRIAGYLRRGLRGWMEHGLPLEHLPQMSVHELREAIDRDRGLQVLDVRSDAEAAEGRIPGAHHRFIPYLVEHLDELDREQPTAVYCGSGYRSNLAASMLRRHGFADVRGVPGSIKSWKAAGYRLES